jgi:hypothetical protein
MTNNTRISHTRGFTLKYKQAAKAVAEGSAVWVVYGESIRQASFAESVAARNKQAAEREPLADAEIAGLTFQPPARCAESTRNEMRLAWEANKFFAEARA